MSLALGSQKLNLNVSPKITTETEAGTEPQEADEESRNNLLSCRC